MGKSRPSLADLVTNIMSQEALIEKIMTTSKVLYGLHLVSLFLVLFGTGSCILQFMSLYYHILRRMIVENDGLNNSLPVFDLRWKNRGE